MHYMASSLKSDVVVWLVGHRFSCATEKADSALKLLKTTILPK